MKSFIKVLLNVAIIGLLAKGIIALAHGTIMPIWVQILLLSYLILRALVRLFEVYVDEQRRLLFERIKPDLDKAMEESVMAISTKDIDPVKLKAGINELVEKLKNEKQHDSENSQGSN